MTRGIGLPLSSGDFLDTAETKDAACFLQQVEPHVLAAAVINLDNVAANYHKVSSELTSGTMTGAVVKADAYGFGAIPISRRLYAEGCRYFFVATIEEGIDIRKTVGCDAEIFVLSGLLDNTELLLLEYKLTPVLNDLHHVELWINFAKKNGVKLNAVVQVDTGIHRNGLSEREFHSCKDLLTKNISIMFILSHLACADDAGSDMNKQQLQKFKEILKAAGGAKGSFSATNGIFLGKDYHFDIIRPGKSLYGFSIREDFIGSMRPVMDLFARVVQVSNLEKGDSVGYGATFVAKKSTPIVTIGMGYADGFMRKFSGFGYGFLGGKKMPMIGRISMDYIVLDATGVDPLYLGVGTWVALTRSDDYTLERWALELGTIPHEMSCRIGSRVKKVYVPDSVK
ncbi:MAG: alanine racemase [Holosporaceae bacterium]|nr:alanine racemase [Holosporaceae bacterium]